MTTRIHNLLRRPVSVLRRIARVVAYATRRFYFGFLSGDDIHRVADVPLVKAGFQVSPVLIGSDVWLAAGAVVLKGVHIGDGAVVAANAVVVSSVAARSVVGGVPAREIGSRNVDTDQHD